MVHEQLPLEEAGLAHQNMDAGEVFGRIVLLPGGGGLPVPSVRDRLRPWRVGDRPALHVTRGLVPELQRTLSFRTSYTGTSLRGRLGSPQAGRPERPRLRRR